MEHWWNDIDTDKNVHAQKMCCSATMSTINAVMTDLGLNQASSATGWQLTA